MKPCDVLYLKINDVCEYNTPLPTIWVRPLKKTSGSNMGAKK